MDRSFTLTRADAEAMADGLARASARFGCPAGPADEGWAEGRPVVTPWAPVGPSADLLPPDAIRLRRRWDDVTWPRATQGYFQLRAAIPDILREFDFMPAAGR